jgi:hypothetical protein
MHGKGRLTLTWTPREGLFNTGEFMCDNSGWARPRMLAAPLPPPTPAVPGLYSGANMSSAVHSALRWANDVELSTGWRR